MRTVNCDKLLVEIYQNRPALGSAVASAVADRINNLLQKKDKVNIIFASAPSQNEFLDALRQKDIDWSRITAFHMDEYIGLSTSAPQSFGYYLSERLFKHVQPGEVNYLRGDTDDPQEECKRYAKLLADSPADIVCLGIGENTHLAFNDPYIADFADPVDVKMVQLDDMCRRQQVNDGCFPTLAQVPELALTITIPALLKATYAFAIVPGKQKAPAIYHTIHERISNEYPSTILRTKDNAVLYIDEDSASRL
jgi:glucosamine-6-phosphate deaminase